MLTPSFRKPLLAAVVLATASFAAQAEDAKAAAGKSGCLACHGIANKIVGPAFTDVAAKYKGDAGAMAKLTAKVRAGGSGNWGPIPMPPQAAISDDELKAVLTWILAGAAG